MTIWPSKMGGRWRFNAFLRDVTEVRRGRRYVQLFADVTEVANSAMSPEAAVRAAVESVCTTMGWPLGHAWLTNGEGTLSPSGWWYRPDDSFDEFLAATERTTLREGSGLPGRVAESREPEWVVDVQTEGDFPRREAATADGLHSGVALPALVADRPVAVLESYTPDVYDVDERTSRLLSSLGVQLGRVFERAEAIAQAEEAQRFKGRMLTTLSHDLNAPAAAIAGFADLLHDDWDDLDRETGLDWTARIRSQADQISQLVSEFLTVERLETGAYPKQARTIDVARIAQQAIHDLGIDALVEVPDGLHVHVDPTHLVRMLTNLVTNAEHHGAPPISVTGQEHNSQVMIRVEDHGPGIDDNLKSRLFQPFAATATEGTGLGLSIVDALASLNGGRVHHEQVEPTGACFVLTFPSVPAP